MENYFYIFIAIIVLICLYLWLKLEKKEIKTKEQKQKEIIFAYKKRLCKELLSYNHDLKSQKKIEILKIFAQELRFNIFFTDKETKKIIEILAKEKC